jgi:hypothetical protein
MLPIGSSGAPAIDPSANAQVVGDCSPAELSGACALLALLVQSQSTTQAGSKTDVELGAKELEDLKKQLADAIQHAKDASKHSGVFGFLGDLFGSDIAQIAGAVAMVAAVIATTGTGAPLIAIALSEALQVSAKAGAELGLDPKICLALSLASVAVGFCTGSGEAQAASTLVKGARYVEVGAKITQGAAAAAGGVLHGVAGYYQRQQLTYQADAVGYQGHEDATNLSIDDAIAQLERALRCEQHETNTASEIVQNDADTNTTLSNRI